MPIKPVLKMGDPCLLQVARPVCRFDTAELHALIQDMHDTMIALNGAGLAAPQIGVDARVLHAPLVIGDVAAEANRCEGGRLEKDMTAHGIAGVRAVAEVAHRHGQTGGGAEGQRFVGRLGRQHGRGSKRGGEADQTQGTSHPIPPIVG